MDKYILWILLILLIVPCGLAEVIVQQNPVTSSNGVTIETPIFERIKINETFTFYFKVYNISNGFQFDNTSMVCSYIIYQNKFSMIMTSGTSLYNSSSGVFYFPVSEGNFTSDGQYSRHITCFNGQYGDFNEYTFFVSANRVVPALSEAIIYIIMFLINVTFLVFIVIAFINIDSNSGLTLGEDDKYDLKIEFGRYARFGLFLLAHLMLWVLIFILWQIADKFLMMEVFASVLQSTFVIVSWTLVVSSILTPVLALAKFLMDLQIQKKFQQGWKGR